VRSEGAGKGSEFMICLPRLGEEEQQRESTDMGNAAATVRRLSLMIVDDNIDAANSLAMLLEAAGHQVAVAYAAQTALERAAVDTPRVFLLDIGLPDMDGYELARRLRAHPETMHAVLIALTGYGQDQDRDRSKAAGFDYHLVKPADPEQLESLLAEIS
jgi:CheY-like chemotaxis protein